MVTDLLRNKQKILLRSFYFSYISSQHYDYNDKVAEAVKKVTQFLTPSTSTKAAVAIATIVVAYKFLKPQKVSANGVDKASVKISTEVNGTLE